MYGTAKCGERGEDEPLKKDDHAVDALRYAIQTHKPAVFDQEEYNRNLERQAKAGQYMRNRQLMNGYQPLNNYGFR